MLRALELVGFKSFAERTRFEFPRGITVVVGPNGSGKSNVVDAIKWVLGEQSVKSLRGKEMADVIFNGSSSRRPLNTAEVTLTFDNSDRLLPVDTPEVHITRRVYRSGEGEYLINRQPCRLRDFRDLFSGTGVATEAYSVIEQGKVDVLLQSSPRERRVIFEEAAGISRFKAKRLETARRLERVEQNLLRLSDIVDEVDSRLKTVRLQASKAKRYQEYADRLQQLRTQVALADWRTLGEQVAAADRDVDQLRTEAIQFSAQAEAAEALAIELEKKLADTDDAIRGRESQIFHNRERIIALESRADHERTRCKELEEQIARDRRHLASMSMRAGDLEQQLQTTATTMHTAESQRRAIASRLADEQRQLTETVSAQDQLIAANGHRRASHLESLRTASNLAHEIGALETRATMAETAQAQFTQQLADLDSAIAASEQELQSVREESRILNEQLEVTSVNLQSAHAQLAETQSRLEIARREHGDFKSRQTAASERAALLEELEKRHEGVDAGVKEVLLKASEATSGPFTLVRGLLADLLHVNVDAAPLIEAALAERAQAVVVTNGEAWWRYLAEQPAVFSGRVSFLRLFQSIPNGSGPDFSGSSGVLGRADGFVEASAELSPLLEHLLGNTWIVESLSQALELASSAGGKSNFVTLAGEVVAVDGSITVGPQHAHTGLISRRSELRALREHLVQMTSKINVLESQLAGLQSQVKSDEEVVARLTAEHRDAGNAVTRHELRAQAVDHHYADLQHQRRAAEQQRERAAAEHQTVLLETQRVSAALAQAQQQVTELELKLAEDYDRIEKLQVLREECQRQANASSIELAKSEQQLQVLLTETKRYQQDQQERLRTIVDSRGQLEQTQHRLHQSEAAVLTAESQLALLYLNKESERTVIESLVAERQRQQQERTAAGQDAQRARGRLRKLEDRLHKKELMAGEIRFERQAIADRLRDEYAVELADLDHEPTQAEALERQQVEEEIADLRRKISSIGGVNLEALEELQELESRHASLASQFQDLTAAKASLEQIISRINTDSRRLFSETLETVRGHFQGLFRNLFGGGQADLVLGDGEDILESGVEIVARPPGKEPRSISLLSGGEKTLTCVALLLAIFRSRPSPFCVLDEVDAALDEANIERFVGVLREFLNWTQFIVVTHSKKTMTCAGTLYGVTMQESGVSKRVSVRFEDVSENGEILIAQESSASAADADEESQAA